MSHIPVNHPLRKTYRALVVLIVVYLAVFGLVGLLQTLGDDPFARDDVASLGLRTNLAFSVASVAAAAIIGLAVLAGRGIYYVVTLWGGVAYLVAGLAMLALLRTDLNVLNFSMPAVIVSFVIGMVLFSAGLYGRTSSARKSAARKPAPAHAGG